MGYFISAGTPYAGGQFKVKLALGKDFPASPPKGYFITKIFHPNVASNGEICVNTLKKDWKPDLGIRHLLLVSNILSFYFLFTLISTVIICYRFTWRTGFL